MFKKLINFIFGTKSISTEYNEGYDTYFHDLNGHCPYSIGTQAQRDWLDGYSDAHEVWCNSRVDKNLF